MADKTIQDLEEVDLIDTNTYTLVQTVNGTKKIKLNILASAEDQKNNISKFEEINNEITDITSSLETMGNARFYFSNYKQGTDTERYTSVINDIKANGGGILIFPEGEFSLNNATLTDNLVIEGQGIGKTIIKQIGTSDYNHVFNGGDISYNNITIKNLSIFGTAESHKTQMPNSGRPIIIKRSKNVNVENIQVRWFAGLGISLLDSYNVKIINNVVEHIGRDAINCAGCKGVIVSNNNINHVGDDAIAVHDASNQTLFVPNYIQGVTIHGNTIYNANGIGCVGAQQYTITNNTLKFVRGTGIFIAHASDVNSKTQIKANIISNNVITDIFDKSDCCGIKIGGGNASFDQVSNTKVETLEGGTNFISNNFVISNNIIGQTMISGQYNANWNLVDTWVLPDRIIYGIRLYGALRDININGNNVTRCEKAIQFYHLTTGNITQGTVQNLVIQNNIITRSLFGYYHVYTGTWITMNIVVNSNTFDLDTYREYSGRNSNGGWDSKVDNYCGIYATGFTIPVITNNYFRNVCNTSNANMQDNNIIDVSTCYDYSTFDYNGTPYGSEKSWINGNRRQYKWGNSIPTTGKWFKSDKVWNTDTRAGRYIGWVCVQSGEFGSSTVPIFKGFGLIES